MSGGRLRLSLLETLLILSIAATVLAVFVPTFMRRLRTDKVAEAAAMLELLHERAAAYYATRWESGLERCLPPQAGPTPAEPSVEPTRVQFVAEETEGQSTWEALGFQPDRPVRYRYRYEPAEAGCGLGEANRESTSEVRFIAEGDLDGDGVLSRFERRAWPGADGVLHPVEELFVDRRVE